MIRNARQPFRASVLARVPLRELSLDAAIERLDAVRWLHRSTHHAWRILHNLDRALRPEPEAQVEHPTRAEIEREERDGPELG